MGTPLKCHLHRPQHTERFPPLRRKWLITDGANGCTQAPAVTISKAGWNFWLVVAGMSLCRDTELSVEPSKSDVENGARVCSQLFRQCNALALATWWPVTQHKKRLVGLKINVQKKCWCKHALQSQWGGESLSFILLNLLRFDMQAPGWLLLERSLLVAKLRPARPLI